MPWFWRSKEMIYFSFAHNSPSKALWFYTCICYVWLCSAFAYCTFTWVHSKLNSVQLVQWWMRGWNYWHKKNLNRFTLNGINQTVIIFICRRLWIIFNSSDWAHIEYIWSNKTSALVLIKKISRIWMSRIMFLSEYFLFLQLMRQKTQR